MCLLSFSFSKKCNIQILYIKVIFILKLKYIGNEFMLGFMAHYLGNGAIFSFIINILLSLNLFPLIIEFA